MQFGVRPTAGGVIGPVITIDFRRAAAGGESGLSPGECTWLDRPIGTGEPNLICHRIEAARLNLQWLVDGAVQSLASSGAPYLNMLVAPTGRYTFTVFNNREGCMVHVPRVLDPRTLPVGRPPLGVDRRPPAG